MILTHEQRLQKAIIFNQERFSGRIASQIATRNLIKADELSPEEMAKLVGIYDAWQTDKTYEVGDIVSYHGVLYEVIQAHTSQADWNPEIATSLFKAHTPSWVIPEWVQPTGSHDAYMTGDKVTFEGKVYQSKIDANTWSPTAYPAGWQEV